MAATTRTVCGCRPRFLFKSVARAGTSLHCNKNGLFVSLSRACSVRVETPVVAARKKLNVTSISQKLSTSSRPLLGQLCVIRCGQNARTAFYSAHCSGPSSPTRSSSLLFPYKHNVLLRCAVFHCRVLGSRNSSDQIQSESKTSAVPAQCSNKFSCPDVNADREQLQGNSTCADGKPEKKENIKTIPNLLTTLRMASAPLLGYMVVCEHFTLALGIFTLAGISDLLDGYIARNFPNQTSALGSALDPLADKLLVTILTVTLTTVGLIPLPLTGLIVFRDVSLIAGGFYIRYRSLHPPITLSRYFDISHATVNVAPTFISKVNTGLQLSLVAFSLAAPVFGFVDHLGLQMLWWMTGGTTFLSGMDYLWSWKKYVTLLEKDQKEL